MATSPEPTTDVLHGSCGVWRCSFHVVGETRFCKNHQPRRSTRIRAKASESLQIAPVPVPVPVPVQGSRVARGRRACDPSKRRKKDTAAVTPAPAPPPLAENPTATVIVGEVLNVGDIWAFSQGPDPLPRSYARVDRIIPVHPVVKLQVTPLLHEPSSPGEMSLWEHGLSPGCGVFKTSGSVLIRDISAFTHRVRCHCQGQDDDDDPDSKSYKIFPKEGEVWAVFLAWDSSINRFSYKLVEIMSDFTEEDGVNAYALARVRVKGRKDAAIYHYQREVHEGFFLIRCFSMACLCLFSHRVPASRVDDGGNGLLWKTDAALTGGHFAAI